MNKMLSLVKRAERAENGIRAEFRNKPVASSLISLLWILVFSFSVLASFGLFLFLSAVLVSFLTLSTFGRAMV